MRLAPLAAALAAAAAISAGLSSTADADVRVGKNYPLIPDANPIYGRDAVGLAVNPRNPHHVVAFYTDLMTLECEVAVSFDRARTWRRTRLDAPDGHVSPPCTVGRHLSALVDQSIEFGREGKVYAAFSSATVDAAGEPRGKSVLVARSRDGGRSFRTAVVARGGADVATGPDYTLPKLAVERRRRGRPDRVYVVASTVEDNPSSSATEEDTIVSVSSDGGRTWSAPHTLNRPGENSIEPSKPVLGRGDALYVAWRTRERGADERFVPEGRIVVSRSDDRGLTWSHTYAASVRGYVYEGPPVPPFTTVRTFTGSAYPQLAADRRSGNFYLVYGNGGRATRADGGARAADHFIHPDQDVYFQRSTNRGRTWSEPDKLNGGAPLQLGVTQTRHPNLSVAPNGRLDVVWQDRRHWYRGCLQTHAPCQEARLGDTYYRYSEDGGASFSLERRITDRSMNNDVGFDYRYGAYWAYGPQSVPIGRDRVLVAWMDPRDGNPETDTMGIYLAQVRLNAARRVPVRRVVRRNRRDLAVQLSRLAYPGGAESVLAGVFASRPWSRVVIVNESDVAGALAAGVLARAGLGPVLLSPARGLPATVKAEVTRLAPIGAYVIGGERSLSERVVDDLVETGIPPESIRRVAGADRAGTAADIARAMDGRTDQERADGEPAFDAAVIVNPASRDAVAVATLAASRRLPVLFAGSTLPAATAGALEDLAIDRTLVIGGRRWIGAGVLRRLPRPTGLGGDDAVATSRAVVAESRRRGLPTNVVFAAGPGRRMDAVLMGAAAGRIGGLQLLAPGGAAEAREALGDLKLRKRVDHLVVADQPRRRSGA